MKHLRSIVLAVALIAAGATACFKDPTSSLRNGPSLIDLTRSSMVLNVGDSLSVQAVVKDAQGNTYDAGDAAWVSDVPAIAAVRKDTSVTVPFNAFSAAFIRGVAAAGGVATVTVTSHGLTNTIRVVVLPTGLHASFGAVVAGAASTDTIAGAPAVVFTAGDTVIFTVLAGGNLTFDPAASLVGFGPVRAAGYVVRTATVIKAISNVPFAGRPWVTKLTFNGPAAVGPIAIDSLQADSVLVARFRRVFKGTVTQTGDTVFLNAPVGGSFSTVATALSGARFGTRAGWVFARTAAQVKVLSPIAYTGHITLTNQMVGSATLDTLYTPVNYTTTIPAFTGAVTSTGDTTFIAAATGMTFDTTASTVRQGAKPAWLIRRTPTQIVVMSPVGTASAVTVTNVHFGLATIDSLLTAATYTLPVPTLSGAITQSADTMFVNAGTGTTFSTTAPLSTVKFGAATAIALAQTATQIKVISPVNWTGPVTATNVLVGTVKVDSLKTPASYTIAQAAFTGAVVAGGNLLDTVKVYGTALQKFSTAAATLSQISMNGVPATVLRRTADSMYVIAHRTSTGPLAVSNVNVGGTIIPTLSTSATVLVGPATGEPNEPGNDVRATATTLAFTGAADTITVYGALDCEDDGTACPGNGDIIDYFQIAYAGGAKLRAIVTWYGNGTGGPTYSDTNNPDIDVAIRDAAANYYSTNTAANGSGSAMPEIATTTTLGAATYYVRVMAWLTPSPIQYKLQLLRTP